MNKTAFILLLSLVAMLGALGGVTLSALWPAREATPTPVAIANTSERDAEAHYQTALQHYNSKEWVLARREAETVLQTNPAHSSASELLVKVKLEIELEKRYADAQDKRLSNPCGASEDFAWVYAKRRAYRQVADNLFDTATKCAEQQVKQGNYADALNALRLADEIKVDAPTRALLGKVEGYQTGVNALNAKQWDEAIGALQPLFAADANFLLTRDNLCKALVERGAQNHAKSEWGAARDDLQQALQVKGDCPTALEKLQEATTQRYAQLAAQCQAAFDGKDYATARALGEEARQLDPRGADVSRCVTGPQAVYQTIASSRTGFSNRQDANGWSYWLTVNSCSSLPTSAYDLLSWDNDTQSWQPPVGPPWVRIEHDAAHPNRCNDVIRRWTSNTRGTIRVLMTVRKVSREDYQGNGTRAYISVNKNARPIWQHTLDCCNWYQLTNAVALTLDVQPGTTLDFGLNSRGDTVSDLTQYEVTIQSVTYP